MALTGTANVSYVRPSVLNDVTALVKDESVLCISWNFEIFPDRFGPGRRDDVTALNLRVFRYRPEIWWDNLITQTVIYRMTSSNGNIFRVTGPL